MVKTVLTVLVVFGGSIALVVAAKLRERRERPRVQSLTRSHENREIIGDGAWIVPDQCKADR